MIQVVQGNLLPPDQIHASAVMAVEDKRVKFGESRFTNDQNPIGSCAASVRGGDGGINDPAGVVNIGSLVRLTHSRTNHSSTNLAALEFTSAKAALGGDTPGVRWIYECYLTSTDYTIRGGDGKKEVATILTADHTGPLLVSIWSPPGLHFGSIFHEKNLLKISECFDTFFH